MSHENEQPTEFVNPLTKEDKDAMCQQLDLIALRIPVRNIGKLGQSLKPYTFQRKGIKSFQPDPQNVLEPHTHKPQFKCLLLHQHIKTTELETVAQPIIDLIYQCDATPISYPLTLTYEQLSAQEVLQSIIHAHNTDIELPTHYESVGHIVHFNLRDELLRYKYLIGHVFLDKLPNSVRTIVNKTGSISNEFRVFPMEIIAGEHQMEATVKENGCRFSFDFSRVYWNSRLGTEHQRICDVFQPQQVVCDMMAGVGPFAVPAAKHKQCVIHANDLNPDSFKYLQQNCKLNHVEKHVLCYNLDGRRFWKRLCQNKQEIVAQSLKSSQLLMSEQKQKEEEKRQETGAENSVKAMENRFIDHVVMNLPAIAIEFLDVFRDCFSSAEIDKYGLPMIHCYCFAPDVNPENSIKERVGKYLGMLPKDDALSMRLVRNVSPHKDMYCVSFRLPAQVALRTNDAHQQQRNEYAQNNEDESPPKEHDGGHNTNDEHNKNADNSDNKDSTTGNDNTTKQQTLLHQANMHHTVVAEPPIKKRKLATDY